MSQASLAYRNNEAAILEGRIPAKYLRLVPHIPGHRILEIGSAEGVLALLLAKDGKQVTALERQMERHETAQWLKSAWAIDAPQFICGDIRDNLSLLEGQDTLVAVRMVYYLGDDLDKVFAEVAKKVPNVVLCGNRNRADRYRAGVLDRTDGPRNYYASREGMKDLLGRHGYRIVKEVIDGDEIVVGAK